MKIFLVLWVMPIVLLGSWYGLSYYDISFGYRILTRELHDLVFTIYGNLLGIPAETIPPLVLKAVIFDSFLVVGFIVIKRRRKQIWSALCGFFSGTTDEDDELMDTSVRHQSDYSRSI